MVRTEKPSGVRSSTGRGPVLAPEARPGPASSAIPELSQDLGHDADIVDRFVSDYLSLLDHRMTVLKELLGDSWEPEAIRVSILSLETTSAMLGADDVVAAARALREAVIGQDQPNAQPLLDRLRQATGTFRDSLVSQGFASPRPPHPVGG